MDRITVRTLLGIALAGSLCAAARAGEPATVSADTVRQWIGQLGSNDYGTREEATVHLIRAGRSAVDPVSVAALQDDLEVACRSIEVLRGLLASEDIATEDAAADALTKIAESRAGSSADLATEALSDFQDTWQVRAMDEIHRLGGSAVIGDLLTGSVDGIVVTLGAEWHGKSADLKILKRIPDLERLSIHGVAITDDDLKQLEGFGRLSTVELFGSKVSAAGAARLAQAYPGIKIDRRSSAMLGVSGQPDRAGCRITRVEAGSAADHAGLMEDDIILKFQDQPVPDFVTLTTLIGARNPGDKVVIELRRGEERLKKEVELGAWK